LVWIILILFLISAAAMYTKRLPALLALPLMAVLIALLTNAQHPLDALTLVFDKGATRLASAMTNAVFGAILAHIVYTGGIAENLVKKTSELAGDRAIPVALLMMLTAALAFVALSGLGAVIMVGTLALPVMVGVGIRPLVAAATLLFGISIGGMWNIASWGFYQDVLHVPVGTVAQFASLCGVVLLAAGIAYVLVNARARRSTWEESAPEAPAAPPRIPAVALLTPLVPVVLILGGKFADRLTGGHLRAVDLDINAALTIGCLYGILTTKPRAIVQTLAGAITEGIRSVAPVLGLMIGIGMVVTALMSEPVKAVMQPLLSGVVPRSPLTYVLFFGLLSPLALYRGPFNLYGLGAGIGGILTTLLAPPLVMGALMCTGMVQGVCDPTNTMNVWAAGFTRTDVNDLLKSTLPYVFVATLTALLIIALTRW
jgi:DcuC family C4-dicarboxylate transporter